MRGGGNSADQSNQDDECPSMVMQCLREQIPRKSKQHKHAKDIPKKKKKST